VSRCTLRCTSAHERWSAPKPDSRMTVGRPRPVQSRNNGEPPTTNRAPEAVSADAMSAATKTARDASRQRDAPPTHCDRWISGFRPSPSARSASCVVRSTGGRIRDRRAFKLNRGSDAPSATVELFARVPGSRARRANAPRGATPLHDDLGAFGGEGLGDRLADPGARAGHERALAAELKAHLSARSYPTAAGVSPSFAASGLTLSSIKNCSSCVGRQSFIAAITAAFACSGSDQFATRTASTNVSM
jgi:hypothetical protein